MKQTTSSVSCVEKNILDKLRIKKNKANEEISLINSLNKH